MSKSIAHYRAQLRDRGLKDIILGRLHWYRELLAGQPTVGWLVERFGDRVSLNGITLSLDNPLIPTSVKGYFYFGVYEEGERKLTTRYLDRALPTIEIGGSIGGVACMVSRLLDNPAAYVVVECSPQNLESLAKNRDLNSCEFSIEPKALAYGSDTISFNVDSFLAGTIHGETGRQISVSTTSVSDILEKYRFDQINLIADCEGAEIHLVINEPEVLRNHVKWFIVEIHPNLVGPAAVQDMLERLKHCGFVVRERHGDQVIAFENVTLSRP
jgi:FkbM family methyltransferase